VATTLNIENADFLLTMDAPRKRQSQSVKESGNREGKISGILTRAQKDGLFTLQAENRLDGWTRVSDGRVVEDVTPKMVADMVERRAKTEREKARAGMPHDVDYLGITVLRSTGSRPSPQAGLGGRFYLLFAPKIGDIAKATFENLVKDVDERAALALTTVRPLENE